MENNQIFGHCEIIFYMFSIVISFTECFPCYFINSYNYSLKKMLACVSLHYFTEVEVVHQKHNLSKFMQTVDVRLNI